MSRFVVDASVAVKWFLPEAHGDAALRLLAGAHSLAAPDLLFAEVGNVLWKRVRRRGVTVRQATATLGTLLSLPLTVRPAEPLMGVAFEMACRTGRSVYDCLYLAVAIEWNCPLVTADRRLYEGLKEGPLAPHLLWITEIPEPAGE